MFHGDEQDLDSTKIPSLQGEGRGWKGIVRRFGMDMYTQQYVKWITNKDLLYSIWNSAQCYMAARMGLFDYNKESVSLCSLSSSILPVFSCFLSL